RKHIYNTSDPSVLSRASCLRGEGGPVRRRGSLVLQQDAVCGPDAAFQLHWRGQGETCLSSRPHRWGLWRQGGVHGCPRLLLPIVEEWPASEDGHGLFGGIDGRQSAPSLNHQS